MKSRLKIAERMVLGFGLMLVVMAAFAWVMDRQTSKIESARRELINELAPVSDAADRLELRVLYIAISARSWLVNPNPEGFLQLQQQVAEARAALLALELMPPPPDSAQSFATAKRLMEVYLDESQRFIDRARANEVQPRGVEEELANRREEALAALRAFNKLQRDKMDHSLVAIQGASTDADRVTSAAVVVALLLSLGLAVLTVRSIREPTKDLVEIAQRLEQGDWTPALQLALKPGDRRDRDELGILRHAFGAAAIALERREQRFKTDTLVAKATGSSLSPEEIARGALDAICAHLQAELGAIYGGSDLNPLAVKGLPAAPEVVRRASIEGKAQLLQQPLGREWLVRREDREVPSQSALAMPIVWRGEVVGVVVVASSRELGREDVAFLEAAATQLGVGLQNVAAHQKIMKLVAEVSEKGAHIQAQNDELQSQNEELQVQGEEIRAQNEELNSQSKEIKEQNDELARATTRLQGQAEVLAEADERKTEFLGVLAHELRNPLAAISNSLFALTHANGNAALRERAEQVISRQSKLLSRLIDDLLDVTRINSGKINLERERVDLTAVLRSAVEDCKVSAERAGTQVELRLPSQPAVVDGDPVRIQQVLGNLIDNAIKFGGEKKAVSVILAVKDDRSTEVRVVDEGVGIDAAVLSRLFVPFSQADTSVQRHRNGLGLGLALVKALVELHGGSVSASSEGLGRGAQFCVTFPPAHELPLPAGERVGERGIKPPESI